MLRRLATLTWRTLRDSLKDEVPLVAAALAFFALLAIIPLIALAVLVGTLALGSGEWVRRSFFSGAQQLFGDTRADALQTIVQGATPHAGDWWALALAAMILLSSLWHLFGALEAALNRIWDVEAEPSRGFWRRVRKRFASYALLVGLSFLLLSSLALSSIVAAVVPDAALAVELARLAATFAGAWILLLLVYHHLPDAHVRWRDAAWGAGVAALLLSLGERLVALFIHEGSFATVYGGLTGIVLALVWAYYSSLIFLVGAEATHVLGADAGAAQPERDIARHRGQKRPRAQ